MGSVLVLVAIVVLAWWIARRLPPRGQASTAAVSPQDLSPAVLAHKAFVHENTCLIEGKFDEARRLSPGPGTRSEASPRRRPARRSRTAAAGGKRRGVRQCTMLTQPSARRHRLHGARHCGWWKSLWTIMRNETEPAEASRQYAAAYAAH